MFRLLILSLFLIVSFPIFATNSLEIARLKHTSKAFNTVAQSGLSSVVSISTIRTVSTYGYSPFFKDPFFQQFYGLHHGTQQREGLGSGVIVSQFGHVLTNHHVISKADEITVTMSDGQEFDAAVIGSDKKTDLALLKLKGKNFPAVQFGNSDTLTIGDWAIAIGNPFGLKGTVTAGIISATGRSGVLDAENYADFIQTDAAINPGNSGGGLFNIDGKLIGINTAIFSQSGGYMGIGFAIPVNMAKRVMEDLIRFGYVKRGKLGVTIQPITDDIMAEYNLKTREGAFVLDVQPRSSAAKSGLKPADIIVALGSKPVTDYLSLRTRVSELKPGEASTMTIIRNGRRQNISFVLEDEKTSAKASPEFDAMGLHVMDITPELRRYYRIGNQEGVIITRVKDGSAAARYRLIPGHVIAEINDKPIRSVRHYRKLIKSNSVLVFTILDQDYRFKIIFR